MKPKNMKTLIAFLTDNPELTCVHPEDGVQERVFRSFENGKIDFTIKDSGEATFIPFAVGEEFSETGVDFARDGFSFSKYGKTIHFKYKPRVKGKT